MEETVDYSFEAVRQKPADSFRPIVTLKPISGFPPEISIPAEDGSGDITLGLESRLQSFVLVENDKKLDSCDVTFLDEEGLFTDPNQLLHGAVIDIAFGYPGLMSQPRRLIVRRLKLGMMQGRKYARRRRGYLVSFNALSPGIIYHSVAPTTNDVYENLPLSSVVKIVTEKLGYSERARGASLALINVPAESDYVRESISRVATENYMQFLQRLANEQGLLLRIDNNGLFFGPRDVEQKAFLVVDLDGEHLLGFELDGDLIMGVPAGIVVVGLRPSDRKVITADSTTLAKNKKKGTVPNIAHTKEEAENNGKPDTDVHVVEPAATQIEKTEAVFGTKNISKAQAIARSRTVMVDFRPSTADKVQSKLAKHYNQRIKKQWRLRIRLVGNSNAHAGRTILLQNFGTALLDGLWYIKEAKHVIDQGGYITELTCRRETGRANKVGDAFLTYGQPTTKDKGHKGETTVQESEAVVGHSKGFDGVNKKTRRRNTHSTDGNFFTVVTTRNK